MINSSNYFQTLDRRLLFDSTVSFVGGLLTIQGDSSDDGFRFERLSYDQREANYNLVEFGAGYLIDIRKLKAVSIDLGDGNNGVNFGSNISGLGHLPITITGGDGVDQIYLNDAFRATIITGLGDDTVEAYGRINTGGGNDRVYGGGTIDTGEGNDSVTLTDQQPDNALIHLGTGNDTLDFFGGNRLTIYGDAGNDDIHFAPEYDNPNTLTTLFGGSGNDNLEGSSGIEYIDAGKGVDSINPHGGNDYVVANDGYLDYITDKNGRDRYLLDRVDKQTPDTRITFSKTGDLQITGSCINDTIGLLFKSSERGTPPLLYLYDGTLEYHETHGDSVERYWYTNTGRFLMTISVAKIKSITIDGKTGGDILDLEDLNVSLPDIPINIRGSEGNDTLTGIQNYRFAQGGRTFIDGGSGNDQIEYGNTVYGGVGDDSILYARNLAHGGDGNDTITQSDSIYGDAGDDLIQLIWGTDGLITTLDGGVGNDTIVGGIGNDRIFGHGGRDSIDGGEGDDTIQGGAADDTLNGGDGNDRLFGNEGVDSINGNKDNDLLYGGTGDDSIRGGDGNDLLLGEKGTDWLEGENGDDTLVGGVNRDWMIGGLGTDRLDGRFGPDDDDYINSSDKQFDRLLVDRNDFLVKDLIDRIIYAT